MSLALSACVQWTDLIKFFAVEASESRSLKAVNRSINVAMSAQLVLASAAPSFNNRENMPTEIIVIDSCFFCGEEPVVREHDCYRDLNDGLLDESDVISVPVCSVCESIAYGKT